ncbi:MAG: hypothetical protein V1790_19790 [Planctomycetota bacterium]
MITTKCLTSCVASLTVMTVAAFLAGSGRTLAITFDEVVVQTNLTVNGANTARALIGPAQTSPVARLSVAAQPVPTNATVSVGLKSSEYGTHDLNAGFYVQPTHLSGFDVRARTFGLYVPELSADASGYLVGNQNGQDGGQIAGIRIDSISSIQSNVVDLEWKNYGIWIKSLSGGHGTWSQYGLKIDEVSGSEYDDYGVYIAGGEKNYFAGNVGIGTTNPTAMLTVSGTALVVNLTVSSNVQVNGALTAGSLSGSGVQLTNLVSGLVKASLYGPRDESTLSAVAATTNQIGLIIDGGVWEISSDLTLSNNIALYFAPGSMFNIHGGKILTIEGPINCGIQQIVDGNVGGFNWQYVGRPHNIPVEWIGVKGQAIGYELQDAAQATQNVERINAYLETGMGLTFGIGCYFINNPILMKFNGTIDGAEPKGLLRGGIVSQILATPDFPFDNPLKPMIFAGRGAEAGQFSTHLIQNVYLHGMNRAYAGIIFTGPQEGDGAKNVSINGCRQRGIEVYAEKNGTYNGPAENFTLENLSIAATPPYSVATPASDHFIGIALRDPCSREVIRNVTLTGTLPECETLTDLTDSIATATNCYAWPGLTNPSAPSAVFPDDNKRYGIVISGIMAMSVSIEDIHTEAFDCGILNLSQCALSIKNYSGSSCFCDIYQDYLSRWVDSERGGGLTVVGFGANAQLLQQSMVTYSLVDRISNYIKSRRVYGSGSEWEYAIPFYSSDMQTRKYITMESSDLASLKVVPNHDDTNYMYTVTNDYSAVMAQPKTYPYHPGHLQNAAYEVLPTTVCGGDVRARTFGLYIPEIRTEASGYLVGNQNGEDSGQQAGIRIDSISSSQTNATSLEWKNYGIWIKSLSGGPGTWSQYGLRIDDVSGSEYDDYGVYIAGGEKNYFAGNVGIGTTNPTALLSVQGTAVVAYLVISNNAQVGGAMSAASYSGSGSGLTNIGGASLNPGSVGSTQLVAGAVTGDKIADQSVTVADLGVDVDTRYVNAAGDAMTGNLVLSNASLTVDGSASRVTVDGTAEVGQRVTSAVARLFVAARSVPTNTTLSAGLKSAEYGTHDLNAGFFVQPAQVQGFDMRSRTFGLYIPELSASASGYLVGNQHTNLADCGQVAGIRIDKICSTQANPVVDHQWKNYGIWIRSLAGGHGTWSQYGLKIDDVSGAQYDDYGVFIAGGEKNYFAGDVGIGTSNPVTKLDVAGSFRVNNGSVFNRIQSGSLAIGTNGASLGVYTTAFPIAFGSMPKVLCMTCQTNASGTNETFAATVRKVTTTNFIVNIKRVDATTALWKSQLRLDWFAWE